MAEAGISATSAKLSVGKEMMWQRACSSLGRVGSTPRIPASLSLPLHRAMDRRRRGRIVAAVRDVVTWWGL